jgi:hypothetical protein
MITIVVTPEYNQIYPWKYFVKCSVPLNGFLMFNSKLRAIIPTQLAAAKPKNCSMKNGEDKFIYLVYCRLKNAYPWHIFDLLWTSDVFNVKGW